MKKFLIIVGFIILIIFLSYKNSYQNVSFSRKEIILKQNKIRRNRINKIIYNDVVLDSDMKNLVIIMIEEFRLKNKDNYVVLSKNTLYNNQFEFTTNDNEKIDFKFYFSNDCENNTVLTSKGMLTADVNELCKLMK